MTLTLVAITWAALSFGLGIYLGRRIAAVSPSTERPIRLPAPSPYPAINTNRDGVPKLRGVLFDSEV